MDDIEAGTRRRHPLRGRGSLAGVSGIDLKQASESRGSDSELVGRPLTQPPLRMTPQRPMREFQYARFSEHGQGLFTPAEIERMMRIEFERAQRHKYPIVCMLVAIDRLGQLQDLYGYESKADILEAVTGVVRSATRDSDYLGILQDDRLLAVFPHTSPESAGLLARRLLSGARKLRFDRDGRTVRVSLSIGVSHNRHPGTLSFDTLVGVAEEGLAVADAAGGDRFVETELYQLYEKTRRGRGDEPAGPAPASREAPPPPAAPEADPLGETVLEVLALHGITRDQLTGKDRVAIAALITSLQDESARSGHVDLGDQRTLIDQLERRIAKLTHLLGITEDELRRVAGMKNIDLGIASIYRTVQGLSDDAVQKEKKRVMMREIFQANLELKKRLSPDGDRPAGAQ
jgi:diguanylate cyclase (GGDEF)-like protein